MHPDLNPLVWTSEGELTEALARRCRLEKSDLEIEPMNLDARGLLEQLRLAAPFTIHSKGRHLGVVECRRGHALVLAPDLSVRRVDVGTLRDTLSAEAEAPFAAEIDRILSDCSVPESCRSRARAALLRERLGAKRIGVARQLRVRPGSSFLGQLRSAGVAARLARLAVAHAFEYVLWIAAWWIVGSAALNGHIDWGWLSCWILTLATIVPLRIFANWSQGVAGIGLGGLLKQRLLAGVLELSPEAIRRQGAGQLLGRAMEAEMVESLALIGGLASAVAALELLLAAAVLALGSGGTLHVLLLAAWVMASGVAAWRYVRQRAKWTTCRLDMTHDLVERMNGHRTRLAQSRPERWHDGEDQALDDYLAASAALDRRGALLSALVPRGWLIAGLCGLGISSAPGFAVGLGGVLLAHQALQRLMAGAAQLSGAAIAWKRVRTLFEAAAMTTPEPASVAAPSGQTILEAHDLSFRYPDRAEPSLRAATLRIERGDWLLLEGSSGSGKSTLAALLAGSRRPESGLLLAGGLDRATLGATGWRKRVATAPQYHENHIFTGSLAFNLLMGRQWPPTAKDMAEAAAVCRELGLGGLLERMPAGLEQIVGDTGWQLSQGERSRVFLARALLQNPELVVLDETFAALDPVNLRQCLECALRRAETLLVVAHP
jgi:ATP-binding cassette subfamily B protein